MNPGQFGEKCAHKSWPLTFLMVGGTVVTIRHSRSLSMARMYFEYFGILRSIEIG